MASKEKQILAEIVEKCEDFQSRQSESLAEISGFTDLYKVKPPKRQDNTFSNPRQTEFFRAASAVGTMAFRMMTSSDPNFALYPVELGTTGKQIDTLRHVFLAQHKWARYRENLLRACRFAPVYGTVICQEEYRVMGISRYGRRIPVTTMVPRVLDQVMFDAGTTDIHSAEWIATSDVTGNSDLMRLAQEAKELKAPWNPKALEAAANDKSEFDKTNWRALERIRKHGYSLDDALSKKRELIFYSGKLDCMNDGVEYIAVVINRKYLVRFHANRLQHGRRPFRVAKWIDFDQVNGLGMGHILGGTHRAMDAHRQKEQDTVTFDAYGMFGMVKDSVASEDAVIAPLKFIPMDKPGDLWRIPGNTQALNSMLTLDDVLKQEFRAASLGTDTLQAIVTEGATATGSSLAQNEGVRALSVIAEQMAESLVREHIESQHANNGENIDAPFNINAAGFAKMIYPRDVKIDLEIEAKTTTDKDFSPKRLQDLQALLAVLVSTKSQHPDQMAISILPIVKEMAILLNVDPDKVILPPNPMMGMGLGAGEMMGLGTGMESAPMDGPGPVNTPVGPTLAS